GVKVGVRVGVLVGVGVRVEVMVGVKVGVMVGVLVGVLVGCATAQMLGGLVRNGENVTLALTASPVPGPAPEGPVADPHQLLMAFSAGEPVLKIPPPLIVAVLPTKQLLLTGPVPDELS